MLQFSSGGTRATPEKRSVRRWFKQLFRSLIGRSTAEEDEIRNDLQDIKELVEIIAREIHRQSKSGKK